MTTAADTLTAWRATLVSALASANTQVSATSAAKTAADDARDAIIALRDDLDVLLAGLTDPASPAMMDIYWNGPANDCNLAISAANIADVAAQAAIDSVSNITLAISQIDLLLAP